MQQLAGENPAAFAERRTRQLFEEHNESIHARTDRMFAWLMPLQWVGGVAVALWVSPRAWAGEESFVHPHVWAALFLGAAIIFWPVFCAIKRPGRESTRQMIAIGQILISVLLIHLTGGRIETHFHVFGSLAFLACYRDWRVLISASAVVALDHLLRGVYFPLSVFGVMTASPYRWLEHAWWVVFEDIFLIIAIRQSLAEMLAIAQRQTALEITNAGIELKVVERTARLEEANRQLVDASRQAGMAEVATNVLHNVGNVLNSVNVSHSVIAEKVHNSRIGSVAKVATLFREHNGDLAAFLTTDPSGSQLPAFLEKLADRLSHEQQDILKELQSLGENIGHIKDIIIVQQTYARAGGVRETLPITGLVEDALRMNEAALNRHHVKVTREFDKVPNVPMEKHKVLQILVNLVSNAKYALAEQPLDDKNLLIRVNRQDHCVAVSVKDNGVGIPAENITRIFAHGFTTKTDGHGFGLHSGVLAAREMGGSLSVHSDGPGTGATFTLSLPVEANGNSRD